MVSTRLLLQSFSAGENFLNRIYSAKPIVEVRDITSADYPLLGCTALYDAMGTTISELQQKLCHDDRVLVTIITDGYENASRTWSGSQIKSLVEELRQMGVDVHLHWRRSGCGEGCRRHRSEELPPILCRCRINAEDVCQRA